MHLFYIHIHIIYLNIFKDKPRLWILNHKIRRFIRIYIWFIFMNRWPPVVKRIKKDSDKEIDDIKFDQKYYLYYIWRSPLNHRIQRLFWSKIWYLVVFCANDGLIRLILIDLISDSFLWMENRWRNDSSNIWKMQTTRTKESDVITRLIQYLWTSIQYQRIYCNYSSLSTLLSTGIARRRPGSSNWKPR